MLSKENFKKKYISYLKYDFKDFDTRRKVGVVIDIIGFTPFIGSFLVLLPIMIYSDVDNKSLGTVLAIGVFGGFLFLLLMKYIGEKVFFPLIDQYHEKIFKPIINTISPDWQYSIDGSVGSIEVGTSKLFDKNYDEYNGNNLVHGKIENVAFRSSLLKIAFRKKQPQEVVPHFVGFFFYVEIKKRFNGETIVVNGDLKNMAVAFKNMASSSKYVEVRNHEFNKIFKVKTSDQTEALSILTPSVISNLVKIQKLYGGPIRFSFIGKRVYCAINRSNRLYKLHQYGSVNTWEFVEKIYDLYALIARLVKELKLN